jgi:hypothetical protein
MAQRGFCGHVAGDRDFVLHAIDIRASFISVSLKLANEWKSLKKGSVMAKHFKIFEKIFQASQSSRHIEIFIHTDLKPSSPLVFIGHVRKTLEGPISSLFNIPLFLETFIKTIPSEMQSLDGESSTYKSTSLRQINPP